jgi:PAS domain S-box-containing protein
VDYDGGYGKTLAGLMPDIDDWDEILSVGEDRIYEKALHSGENTLTYETRISPLLEPGGNSLGQIVVMTDITRRKIYERNLWTSNELLERMFSSLHHMVVFMDLEFNYIKVNKAYAEYFGHNPEEMIGQNHFQLVEDNNTRQVFKNVIDTGLAYSTVGRPWNPVKGREPNLIWEWSVQAVHDKSRQVNGLVMMMFDVTEREQAIRALRESEQKYRILAENTYDWEFWLGPDGKFIYVSPACERISGYKPEEFQRNPALMETIILPEDLNIYHSHQDIAVVAREAHEAQFRLRRKDGRLIWLAHSCQPIFTADKIYLGNRGNNQDVTDKHQAAEEIARTAAIVKTTDDAIYSVDQDNVILSWNPAAEKMYGYSADEMIGNSVFILVPNERRAELATIRNRLIGGESISHLETIRLRKDGSSIPVSLTYSPIPNKQGEFTHASVIARDISRQKEAEEAVRRRAMELEALYETSLELNDEKDLHVLLAAITHRVTNLVSAPMASIFLVNEDRTELEMVSKYNLPRDITRLRIKVGDGVTGTVAASGKPINVADYQQDELWRTRPNLFKARRFLAVPMVWNGEVIGVIDVADGERSGYFSVDHVHLVSLFANQAAIALRNAREVDRLWHQATTDTLTGLDNRRHFMELAQSACNRAIRKKLPLAILMIDIDHFKAVNDRWGHQQGDIVLVQVAEICKKSLRRGDIIGRYGGEEFIALLPNIQLEQALKIAGRVV